jgi:alpha-beta hydrolase superfamily lysophospholipase
MNSHIKYQGKLTLKFDIVSDLTQAGIGKKPFIIVSFSMGGVIARNMIL